MPLNDLKTFSKDVIDDCKNYKLIIARVENPAKLFKNKFTIDGKEIYFDGYEDDSEENVVLMVGSQRRIVPKDEAITTLTIQLQNSMWRLAEKIYPKIDEEREKRTKLVSYLSSMIHNTGYFSAGELATKKYLEQQGFQHNAELGTSSTEPKEWIFEYNEKSKKINFTEKFHLENYSKYTDVVEAKQSHMATVEYNSSISVVRAEEVKYDERFELGRWLKQNTYQEKFAIEHSVDDIKVDRKNSFGYKLFPSEGWKSSLKKFFLNVGNAISNFFSKSSGQKISQSFSNIMQQFTSLGNDDSSDKIASEIAKIEKNSNFKNVTDKINSIISAYRAMSLDNYENDSLLQDVEMVYKNIDIITKAGKSKDGNQPNYADPDIIASHLDDLKNRLGKLDLEQDAATYKKLSSKINSLEITAKRLKFFRKEGPSLSQTMKDLCDLSTSEKYIEMRHLGDQLRRGSIPEYELEETYEVMKNLCEDLSHDYASINKRMEGFNFPDKCKPGDKFWELQTEIGQVFERTIDMIESVQKYQNNMEM